LAKLLNGDRFVDAASPPGEFLSISKSPREVLRILLVIEFSSGAISVAVERETYLSTIPIRNGCLYNAAIVRKQFIQTKINSLSYVL